MKNRWKHIFIPVLAAALCLSLAACGGTDNDITGDDWRVSGVVAGTADECRARILDYMAAGVEMPVCFEVGGDESPLEQLKSIHAHLLAD